ncbi:putative toxin-antitoxin system toxin component, PIN family, partial [Candidatus Microgenomates bacterium]|nr:putative toxin-antitoxin system toxin component, PIN family [Candidatus Microgenomates bacterium]
MRRHSHAPVVFFNASVILAGLYSPSGGSGKLLLWVKNRKINGLISEIILDEVCRRAPKIKQTSKKAKAEVTKIFSEIAEAPERSIVSLFDKIIIDRGDSHVLASCSDNKADYLVTLDKKHLLILQKKIREFHIVYPKELIEKLARIK